jgi:DNA anti-recombination protein RmuC
MEQRNNFIDEGIGRLQEAWGSVEDEFGKLQKNFEKRRKDLEKQAGKRVKKFERSPFGKRVVTFRDDAQKQIQSNFDSVFGLLPLASRSDVKRLERKVTQLGRKLSSLEKAGSAKQAPPTETGETPASA